MSPRGHLVAWSLCLASALAAGACDSAPADSASAASVRDSAGIVIREVGAAPWASPRMEVREIVRHGDGPGDYPFQRILYGALDSDSSAVVYDAGSREVVRIGRAGQADVLLSRGRGPAELAQVFRIATHGDSLLIDDVGNAKVLVVVGDSVLASLPKTAAPNFALGYAVEGVAPNGRLVLRTNGFPLPQTEGWISGQLLTWAPDLGVVDTVAVFPLAYVSPVEAQRRRAFPPSGYWSYANERWVLGRSDVPEVRKLDANGALLELIRWPHPANPESARDRLDRYATELPTLIRISNPRMSDDEVEAQVRRTLDRLEVAESDALPLFNALIATPQNEVWIGDYGFPDPPATYALLSAEGNWRGHIRFSRPTKMLDADGGLILGVFKGDLGEDVAAIFEVSDLLERSVRK